MQSGRHLALAERRTASLVSLLLLFKLHTDWLEERVEVRVEVFGVDS